MSSGQPDLQSNGALHLSAIVLAAGQSQRMGSQDKLTALLGERPVLAHALAPIVTLNLRDIIVVVPPGVGTDYLSLIESCGARYIENPKSRDGIGTSIACGVRALNESCDGVLICLGDMPFVSRSGLMQLVETFQALPCARDGIIVPVCKGARGHPVVFGSRYFGELKAFSGDKGARELLTAHAHAVQLVEVSGDAHVFDIDTAEDLTKAEDRLKM